MGSQATSHRIQGRLEPSLVDLLQAAAAAAAAAAAV